MNMNEILFFKALAVLAVDHDSSARVQNAYISFSYIHMIP